jgi:hypothetical protein
MRHKIISRRRRIALSRLVIIVSWNRTIVFCRKHFDAWPHSRELTRHHRELKQHNRLLPPRHRELSRKPFKERPKPLKRRIQTVSCRHTIVSWGNRIVSCHQVFLSWNRTFVFCGGAGGEPGAPLGRRKGELAGRSGLSMRCNSSSVDIGMGTACSFPASTDGTSGLCRLFFARRNKEQ